MMWSRRWPRFINVWDIPQEMLSSGCSRFLEPEGRAHESQYGCLYLWVNLCSKRRHRSPPALRVFRALQDRVLQLLPRFSILDSSSVGGFRICNSLSSTANTSSSVLPMMNVSSLMSRKLCFYLSFGECNQWLQKIFFLVSRGA